MCKASKVVVHGRLTKAVCHDGGTASREGSDVNWGNGGYLLLRFAETLLMKIS